MIKRYLLILLLLMPLSTGSNAEVGGVLGWIVVVNQQSGLTKLSKKQVMSLFLGRSQFLPGGSRVSRVRLPGGFANAR